MKELIKEETLDIVRQMITDGQVSQEVAEKYFPELKESEGSEDERIKKAIKYGLDYVFTNNTTVYETTKEQCLAWLEKQGEQNKVEPKFKHGDWIVTNKNHIWYVDETPETTSYLYRLINQYGKAAVAEFEVVDNVARLWTIQDAKAGDVLYLQKDGKEHIIIYKGVTKERFTTFVSAYCAYNGIVDAFCFADVSRYVDIAYGGIMPATKEQRDTLMKAMADDGYTFDFDKKELKKIEQELTIIPKFKVGDIIRHKKQGCTCKITAINTTEYEVSGCNGSHLPFDFQDAWELVKQNSNEWSEEDEKHLNRAINILDISKTYTTSPDRYEDTINWLKSLKDRFTWKPSGEQMKWLHDTIESTQYEPRKQALISLYSDLMKLREE